MPFAHPDPTTHQLTLEQAHFVSFCQTYLDYLSDDDFLQLLEGFLEASLVSEHKEKTLAAVFNDHVLPNFLEVPTNSIKPPKLPFVSILLSYFVGPKPGHNASFFAYLNTLHPNNNTMWCFFLGNFSRLTRDHDDKSFTNVVDAALEKYQKVRSPITVS